MKKLIAALAMTATLFAAVPAGAVNQNVLRLPTVTFPSEYCNDFIVVVDKGTFPVTVNGVKVGYAHPASYSSPIGFTVHNGDVVGVYKNPRPGNGGAEIVAITVRGCPYSPTGLAFTGIEDVAPIGAIALALLTGGTGLMWLGRKRDEEETT
jgi:hypothetical protein